MLAGLPLPALVIDPAGRVTRANAAAEDFFNMAAAQMIERGLDAVLPGQGPVAALLAGQRADALVSYDVELGFRGGRIVRADVMLSAVTEAPGWRTLILHPRPAYPGIAGQREQRVAARSAAGVAAMLAHEIKNPLSGIRGAAQLLAGSVDDDGQELTDLICAEVDRVGALIDRMETFGDERPRAHEPENIHAVLDHVRRVAQRGFASQLQFRERYDPSLPPVVGDRDALIQIFLNLIKNAAEASPDGGEIVLTTAFRTGLHMGQGAMRRAVPIEVCVLDDGAGPPPALADCLFEPFVSSKVNGTGLGLALVAKLVGDHGGAIEHDRVGDPPRTCFRVLLPVAA